MFQGIIHMTNNQNTFLPGQKLQHLKTGGFYRILHLAKIEATLEDVYVYEALINHTIWIRPKLEMEDGRFIPMMENI
jgi:hypothetical protein